MKKASLRLARFCLPAASESDINYIIIQQLPQRAREVLATLEYAETSKITQALVRMDLARKDQENGVAHANMQNGSNRPNNNNVFNPAKPYSKPVRQMGRPNSYRDDRNAHHRYPVNRESKCNVTGVIKNPKTMRKKQPFRITYQGRNESIGSTGLANEANVRILKNPIIRNSRKSFAGT